MGKDFHQPAQDRPMHAAAGSRVLNGQRFWATFRCCHRVLLAEVQCPVSKELRAGADSLKPASCESHVKDVSSIETGAGAPEEVQNG